MERVAANGHLGAATDVGQRQQPAFSLSGLFIASALKREANGLVLCMTGSVNKLFGFSPRD